MTRGVATRMLFVVTLLVSSASLASAQPTARPDQEAIQRLLAKRIDQQRRSVGIVVGIVTPEGTDIVSHGVTRRGASTPVDGATRFEIGSLTKVFTALLLTDLARTGEIDIDAPLSELIGQ